VIGPLHLREHKNSDTASEQQMGSRDRQRMETRKPGSRSWNDWSFSSYARKEVYFRYEYNANRP
jgi:hypothetical protein